MIEGEEYFHVLWMSSEITKLEFSQCGKYYILNIGDSSRPHIYPLPWEQCNPIQSDVAPGPGTHIAKKRKLELTPKGSFDLILSDSNGLIDTVRSSSSIVDPQAAMVLSIAPEYTDDLCAPHCIQLTRYEADPENNSSYTIVTMPQTTNTRNTKVTLARTSQDTAERIRIVLTPEAQNTYESDTFTVSQHLPAVIHRETATLIPTSVQRHTIAPPPRPLAPVEAPVSAPFDGPLSATVVAPLPVTLQPPHLGPIEEFNRDQPLIKRFVFQP
jgi:hypothetical protein